MVKNLQLFLLLCFTGFTAVTAQDHSIYIVVDQFGYLPESKKIAVIRDPQVGFDADDSFTPGSYYCVVNATTGEKVYRSLISKWKNGQTDESSGDKAWHFYFSVVDEPGTYFILDEELNLRSYEFVISHNVYNEVLKQAMRTFFYQRAGFAKEAQYAGEEWADGASHIGPLQDKNCRSFFDKDNPDTGKDLSGGWYDAGDYNKYTNWTANYVAELMKAYIEKPDAWADDYNIPESGNGVPDILDEAKWGIDHLLRMQQADGSVLSIVGLSHGSPPSSADGPSYYGPANTSATMNTAAAFAVSSKVFRSIGQVSYADTLLARAIKAWDWGVAYPDALFKNNDATYNSSGLGAGQQEVDDYGRKMIKLEAACYLFEVTEESVYREYFDAHYTEANMFDWSWIFPFQGAYQDLLLYYTTLENGSSAVQEHILEFYKDSEVNDADNLPAYVNHVDPYMAYIKDYGWGSNNTKSRQGIMAYNLIEYGMADGLEETARESAEAYIHYIHGVNPLNFAYLSNMYDYGADYGVNEFYHSWFSNGSAKWDRVGESTCGPAPGYVTGGANPSYDWDGCCPNGCGSAANNSICTSEFISPPKNQPDQKSYKDFNTSWPLNSWSVTENSCGYQVSYIRLLSKYVTASRDCYGDDSGTAFIDSCGVCAGGNTGIIPNSCDDAMAIPDGDTMYVEGRHIYTAAGEKVILRGVNEMFVWSDDKTGINTLPEIAKTGANCVRLVWTEEEGNKNILVRLIENCIENKMIAMPECHSATGEWENLDVCINFWKDPVLIEGVQKYKKWTLVNIGNEVGDGNVTASQFRAGYMRAIDSLRSWGYTVPIVIDASTWGQNVDVIFSTWKDLLTHDPLKNVIFSVHSYWSTPENYNRIATRSVNEGLPVIVGEGPSPTSYPRCQILDFEAGLSVLGRNDIGWLAWSWGLVSNGHCIPNFDHTTNGKFGYWETGYSGSMIVRHEYSLMKTARRPLSFFDNDTVPVAGIWINSEKKTAAGDSVLVDIVISPANVFDNGYSFEITGDTAAVSFNPASGWLTTHSPGNITLKATSNGDNSIFAIRTLEIQEVPVSAISIEPSNPEIFIGDTIYLDVSIFPENATNKEFTLLITDDNSAVEFDESSMILIALDTGIVEIQALWDYGDVEGQTMITIHDPTVGIAENDKMKIMVYPNPFTTCLNIDNSIMSPYRLMVFNLTGNKILDENRFGNTRIDTHRLLPGYYEIIITFDEYTIREKLIKI